MPNLLHEHLLSGLHEGPLSSRKVGELSSSLLTTLRDILNPGVEISLKKDTSEIKRHFRSSRIGEVGISVEPGVSSPPQAGFELGQPALEGA